jgi:hypothetical protein
MPFDTPGTDYPNHEDLYIGAIRDYVRSGDRVVLVGGGRGISTVAAASRSRPDGTVQAYEPERSLVERCREVVDINNVADRVTVYHAIVGSTVRVGRDGEVGAAETVAPAELPECDALLIDCDGAEETILDGLTQRPRLVIVEHHAVRDSDDPVPYDPDQVARTLHEMGYRIEDRRRGDIPSAHDQFGTEETVFVALRNNDHSA